MTPSADVDPEILAARARQAAGGAVVDFTKLPPAESRRLANKAALFFVDGQPPLAKVETRSIPGSAGPIRARFYWPNEAGSRGAVLFLHGGGWFSCDVNTHDRTMRCLARDSGLMIVGVDYRLSPEHAYPAALEDCTAAWRWLVAHAASLGLDPARIGVAGDSGGANLALALSLSEQEAGRPAPAVGALFYGCFAPIFDTPSHERNGDGRYGLTTERMRWYWDNYLGSAKSAPPILATPLMGSLAGLGPQYLNLAEFDPLADETRCLARRLEMAGVEVELDEWPGAVHGFMQMTRDVALARAAVAKAARILARWLGR